MGHRLTFRGQYAGGPRRASPGRPPPTVVGGALGECVHVTGVFRFLGLAEHPGWRTVFLGPAVCAKAFIRGDPPGSDADLVALGFRVAPENGESLIRDYRPAVEEAPSSAAKRFFLRSTLRVVARARALGWIERSSRRDGPVE